MRVPIRRQGALLSAVAIAGLVVTGCSSPSPTDCAGNPGTYITVPAPGLTVTQEGMEEDVWLPAGRWRITELYAEDLNGNRGVTLAVTYTVNGASKVEFQQLDLYSLSEALRYRCPGGSPGGNLR